MLPSVKYQSTKRASSSQARFPIYIPVQRLLYANRNAFLPCVSLVLEPLVPPLSLIHSTAPFSPPTFVLTYQFHSTCVVAAVFTATPLPDPHDQFPLLVVCLVPDAATVVPRCAHCLPILLPFTGLFFLFAFPPLRVLFASDYSVLLHSRGSYPNVRERPITATVSGSVRVGQRGGV